MMHPILPFLELYTPPGLVAFSSSRRRVWTTTTHNSTAMVGDGDECPNEYVANTIKGVSERRIASLYVLVVVDVDVGVVAMAMATIAMARVQYYGVLTPVLRSQD